ncbi:MAG: hypothetical protein O2890_05770 [Cyanobacteria bacterium]|nr:hypothetical protein [Cyanobacteriota bacterium]MDA0865915.1 hypothetical protein [Cyanobacteriota bacterium]
MIDPLFWLALSFLLVAVCLTAVLLALIPATQELGRAARSVEKLCDTISRELPPTLESIRLTSLEITELADDVTEGVQNAGRVAQQVDQGLSGVKQQAQRVQVSTRSVMAGMRAALGSFTKGKSSPRRDRRRLSASSTRPLERLERSPHRPSQEADALPSHGIHGQNTDGVSADRNGSPLDVTAPESLPLPAERQSPVTEDV